MSSLSEIYFNYDKAIKQADRLDSIAKGLSSAGAAMTDILGDVYKAWRSDSAPAYIKKGEKVEQDMGTTEKNLREIAQTIRIIAQRIRDAELAAWRIANERK